MSPADAANLAADVGKFKTDQLAIPTAQTNVQSLQKAQHALELTESGPSTASVHAMYGFLSAQGILPQGLKDDVTNYDLFKKYTLDYARQSGAAANTNLQLQASEGSNAGPGISTDANLNVLKTNIGRQRQQIAQVMEAPNQNGIGYGAHAAAFSNNTDPRGFAVDSYAPSELQRMISTMTPAEQTKFFKSVGMARRLGLVAPAAAPPSQAPAAPPQ